MALPCLKHMISVLFVFMLTLMSPAGCFILCRTDLTGAGAFTKILYRLGCLHRIISLDYRLLLAFFKMKIHFLLFDLFKFLIGNLSRL